ncbi:hypothetical protein CSC12_1852 [Klebsiella michiganensis]|nr:hypothetical protein CSC12_1852 [Klebsiella michiganensis]
MFFILPIFFGIPFLASQQILNFTVHNPIVDGACARLPAFF